VRSIFERDHPGTADDVVIEAFRRRHPGARRFRSRTGPTSTCASNLPVCDPEKITVPTLIMRGEFDGIASFQDLTRFFEKLPNPDKQLAVMPGVAHCLFPSEELRDLLPHPGELLRPAGSDLSGRALTAASIG